MMMKMDEKEIKEILESCSAMVFAVEELSADLPEVKKMYQDGKKLLTQIKKEEKQLESKTKESVERIQDVTDKNLDLLEKMQKKTKSVQNALETSCQEALAAQELAETMKEFLERFNRQEKRIAELERKIENLTKRTIQEEWNEFLPKQAQRKTGRLEEEQRKTLGAVLKENGMRFPIIVHRKSWTRDFYFVVRGIENGYAYGENYRGGSFYRDEKIRLEKEDFELYEEEIDRSIFYALLPQRA